MPYKRFFKKKGYDATVYSFMNGRQFIQGIGSNPKVQMMELLAQFTICKNSLGYFPRICEANTCMGVPVCNPTPSQIETKKRTN